VGGRGAKVGKGVGDMRKANENGRGKERLEAWKRKRKTGGRGEERVVLSWWVPRRTSSMSGARNVRTRFSPKEGIAHFLQTQARRRNARNDENRETNGRTSESSDEETIAGKEEPGKKLVNKKETSSSLQGRLRPKTSTH